MFEDRFLESWVGSVITHPATAIVELVANCWDAYATEVNIIWPDSKEDRRFSIKDNGVGMTLKEFQFIWWVMSYDRVSRCGSTANPPPDVTGLPRPVFGRNGKGRFAAFCFSSEYLITSRKDGEQFTCRVYRTTDRPLVIEEKEHIRNGVKGHGTEIESIGKIHSITLSEAQARESLGGRFLANPSFRVLMNGEQITFDDLSDSGFSVKVVNIPEIGEMKILHLDTFKADRSTRQHGIAWWVLNRAVGDCKWRGSDYQRILDGRTSEAKRYTFIVEADFLNAAGAVKDDWSWFKEDNETWNKVLPIAQDTIKDVINLHNRAQRDYKRENVFEKMGHAVNTLPLLSKDRVRLFMEEVVNNCPNLGEQEILQLSTILAKLEKAHSRYGLLEILHNQDTKDLDSLHQVLAEWTIGMAKIVLDEIQNRLKLINKLRSKIQIAGIDEVHELQPIFEKGLWMFGAQFESIEFTSNKGMTTVIQKLLGKSTKGSLMRPDFVILPKSSVGFYARPSYDEDYNEDGFDHIVIVDLKTTGLKLGSKEKEQVWKYVKELRAKGFVRKSTRVDGFVLGSEIEKVENDARTEGSNIKIQPYLYDAILTRAENRLLNLHSKVKDAPFLREQKEQLNNFIKPIPVKQTVLFSHI